MPEKRGVTQKPLCRLAVAEAHRGRLVSRTSSVPRSHDLSFVASTSFQIYFPTRRLHPVADRRRSGSLVFLLHSGRFGHIERFSYCLLADSVSVSGTFALSRNSTVVKISSVS